MGELGQRSKAVVEWMAQSMTSSSIVKVETVEANASLNRGAALEEAASALGRSKTSSFGISGTGNQVLWRARVGGVKRETRMYLHDIVESGCPHGMMMKYFLQEARVPGVAALAGDRITYWNWQAVTVVLLRECAARDIPFFEDSFRMLDEFRAAKNVNARKESKQRERAVSDLRKALRLYFDNGGDADELRVTVDEEIARRVLQS